MEPPFYAQSSTGREKTVTRPLSYFHLHLISDATGETLLAAGRAAAAQYANARAIEHIYPLIRTEKQLRKVLENIDAEPGIVLYTIVDQKLAAIIDETCAEMGVPSVSVLEPVLNTFQSYPARQRTAAPVRSMCSMQIISAGSMRSISRWNMMMGNCRPI